MTHGDLHERVLAEIETRRASLGSGDDGALTPQQVGETLAVLDADERLLREHWRGGGVVADGEPVTALACGNPQPCPHTLGLAEKYGVV